MKRKKPAVRDSGALRAYARPREGETNSVADEDVYDSRKNRTDRWLLEEPVQQEARYMQSLLGHVMTLAGVVGSSLQLPPFFKVWTLRPNSSCPSKSHTFSWFIVLVKKPLVLFFLTLGKKSDDKTYNTIRALYNILMHHICMRDPFLFPRDFSRTNILAVAVGYW